LLRDLMLSDLNDTHLFDGSIGVVYEVQLLLNSIVDAIHQADLASLKELLIQSKQYEKWFSFHQATYPLFCDWTVVHFSASISSSGGQQKHRSNLDVFKHLMSDYGCSVLSCDKFGRTPLHVAAASLNHTVALYITEVLPSTVRIRDLRGHAPFSSLLVTLSLTRWTKRISSPVLEALLVALLPPSQSAIIWEHLHSVDKLDQYAMSMDGTLSDRCDTTTLNMHRFAAIRRRSAYARLTNLYYSVLFTDDGVSQAMIKTASSVAKSSWRRDVVEEVIYGCVAKARELTVDLLLSEFEDLFPIFDCRLSMQEEKGRMGSILLGVLDTCLCYALVRSVNRSMLSALLHRYAVAVDELCTRTPLNEIEGLRDDQSFLMDYSCFFILAIIKQDLTALNVVRSILPSSILRSFIYPPDFRFADPSVASATAFPRPKYDFCSLFQLRLLRFTSMHPSKHVLSFARDFGGLSPLGLASAIGDPDVLQALLRCCAHIASDIRSQHEKYPHSISTSQSEIHAIRADFQMPVLICVYFGHSTCLHVLRSYLGNSLLHMLCYTVPGEKHHISSLLLCDVPY